MAGNWAICIGINHYENLQPLKYAVNDADDLRDWLIEKAGFSQKRVYYFADNSPPITDASKPYKSQPTYGKLMRFLNVRFKKPFLKSGDNLWFFFSGHGMRYQEQDYLMLSDSDPDGENITRTAIPLNFVTQRLRKSGADNVMLFVDACRESIGKRGLGTDMGQQQGIITIASCSPNELSYEVEKLEHGSFTYALLESLEIQGESNCATLERLAQRLELRVNEINREYRKPRQTPYAVAEPASKYHLILLPDYIQPTLDDIATLREDALEAEAENNLKLAESLWTRLVQFDREKSLRALRRIWIKLERQEGIPESDKVPKTEPGGSKAPEITVSKLEKQNSYDFKVITVNARGQEIKRESRQAEYFTEDLGNDLMLEMVSIPGGKFLMGTESEEIERLVKKFDWEGFRREKPQHEVTVKSFYMGRYPITQAQWQAVMGNNPAEFKDSPQNPVEQVSWHDAVEFCQKLSAKTGREYCLPSEAEWEYACRAGTKTAFHFGETITGELANYHASNTYADEAPGKYREKTTPVGSFPPNGFGLYDMHGNVWEWCVDNWHDNYEGAPTDGRAWTTGGDKNNSSLRGGSWYSVPDSCRSAFRVNSFRRRDDINFSVGFRVVSESGSTLLYQS